jgi:acyl carrier protein
MTPASAPNLATASTPSSAPDAEPLFETVRDILVDCLACEPENVVPQAGFFDELGGESIEVLDFSFRVERALRIAPPLKRFQIAERWTFDEQGRVTQATREWLTAEMSTLGLPSPEFDSLRTYHDLLTVEFLMATIRHAVAERDHQATVAT